MQHRTTHSKVLKISDNLGGFEYYRLESDWGTEYSLTACSASDDAVEARYSEPIELDGREYILFRYCGEWAVVVTSGLASYRNGDAKKVAIGQS